MHHTVKNLSTLAVLYIFRIWNHKIVYICMYIDKIFCLQMTNFYLINRWPSYRILKNISVDASTNQSHVVIPCHVDFRFRLRIASSRITSSWPNSKKQISFVIGVGLFTIVYSREEIEDQSGRKEKDRRREGDWNSCVSFSLVHVNEPRSRFFFSCNTRIKVNGSYFREIMKGQARLGSSLHLFRTLSFSL